MTHGDVKISDFAPSCIMQCIITGAYEPPEGRREGASNCVERHLNLNGRDTSLIWTYSQVGRKCFHSQSASYTGPPAFML